MIYLLLRKFWDSNMSENLFLLWTGITRTSFFFKSNKIQRYIIAQWAPAVIQGQVSRKILIVVASVVCNLKKDTF